MAKLAPTGASESFTQTSEQLGEVKRASYKQTEWPAKVVLADSLPRATEQLEVQWVNVEQQHRPKVR